MGRINRKNWTGQDMGILNKGGFTDLFDNAIKSVYRINDDEYDNICDLASDDEFDILLEEKKNYKQKKQVILILNKYIKYDN